MLLSFTSWTDLIFLYLWWSKLFCVNFNSWVSGTVIWSMGRAPLHLNLLFRCKEVWTHIKISKVVIWRLVWSLSPIDMKTHSSLSFVNLLFRLIFNEVRDLNFDINLSLTLNLILRLFFFNKKIVNLFPRTCFLLNLEQFS